MKRKALVLLLNLFFWINLYAQEPASIVSQIPSISPPSPTVAGLMKFEEVPVNNYTGIPEISIPLYSVETLSKDIKMDIALKYHPSSIAVEEVASYTGLGWSLFAGGSISRTVKGSPDNIAIFSDPKRVGLYYDETISGAAGDKLNRYHEVLSSAGQVIDEKERDLIVAYIWGATEKGEFDTEHDLYQYNFMGHTGRFFVHRDQITKKLSAVKLDNDNAITIKLNYKDNDVILPAKYSTKLISFELTDDKGYRYVFADIEMTKEYNTIFAKPFSFGGIAPSDGDRSPAMMEYESAFNLTEIFDCNNQKIVKITYQNVQENVTDIIRSSNSIPLESNFELYGISDPNQIQGLMPVSSTSRKRRETPTKKISTIEVINKAKIVFNNLIGRQDSNINATAAVLNSVTVYDWYGLLIKKYNFAYDYSTINSSASYITNVSRLILTDVKEVNVLTPSETLNHTLSYKNPNVYVLGSIYRDYWGYFSQRGVSKEPDSEWCTAGVLEKITLPSGGNILFDYGPNTYSYIGKDAVTDFTIDDDYYPEMEIQIPIPTGPDLGHVPMNPSVPIDAFFVVTSPIPGGRFWISENTTPGRRQSIDCLGDGEINDGSGYSDVISLEANKKYTITYQRPPGSTGTVVGRVKMYNNRRNSVPNGLVTPTDKWLMGGGIRINKISYFEGGTSSPVKEKHYNYQLFTDASKSSGSLVFAKPIYKFKQGKTALLQAGGTSVVSTFDVTYTTTTTHNNLLYIRTKGSDVGYKNVRVWETGNGKSEYTYTSPIDSPEDEYVTLPPFKPSKNFDFKRGLLQNEKHYSEYTLPDNTVVYRKISEKTYVYTPGMNESFRRTGHRLAIIDCPKSFPNFGKFIECLLTPLCSKGWAGDGLTNGMSYITNYMSLGEDVEEYFGWPTLQQKTSIDYSYEGTGTVAKTITTTENYGYNFANKKLSTSNVTNSLGEILTTNYLYDTNGSDSNRIGVIKKIESKKGSALLETKDITYESNIGSGGNIAWLPKTISVSKAANALEPRVQFIKYDQFSNPLEAKQENGMSVCYIWGYNSSQPIAVIENITYSAITAQKITDAQAASDVVTTTEAQLVTKNTQLLTKLEALRTSLPATAMMSAYIYRPLVGVVTMIDPRGLKTTYSYDGFGRLKEVKDNDGNLLSENDYRYRN